MPLPKSQKARPGAVNAAARAEVKAGKAKAGKGLVEAARGEAGVKGGKPLRGLANAGQEAGAGWGGRQGPGIQRLGLAPVGPDLRQWMSSHQPRANVPN